MDVRDITLYNAIGSMSFSPLVVENQYNIGLGNHQKFHEEIRGMSKQERSRIVLVLEGGADVEPYRYGSTNQRLLANSNSRRDNHDFSVLSTAIDFAIPVFGICRGHQVLGVHFGCTLYQDLYADLGAVHTYTHNALTSDKEFSDAMGADEQGLFGVNSIHHQAIHHLPYTTEHKILATNPEDGIIEAMLYPKLRSMGVQWHPELLSLQHQRSILEYFISKAWGE